MRLERSRRQLQAQVRPSELSARYVVPGPVADIACQFVWPEGGDLLRRHHAAQRPGKLDAPTALILWTQQLA